MNPTDDPNDDLLRTRLRRAVDLEEPPASLVHAAIGLFRAPQPSVLTAAAAAVRRRVQAVLGFDSWAPGAAAFATRGAAAADPRQLLFTAQGRDVDLRIAPSSDGRFILSGQVLGPDETGVVRFVPGPGYAAASRDAVLDSLGEFRIDGIDAGTWHVAVVVGGDEIVLPPVEVGQRRP